MDNSDVFVIKIEHEGDWWYHGKCRTRNSSEGFQYDKESAEKVSKILRFGWGNKSVTIVSREDQQ